MEIDRMKGIHDESFVEFGIVPCVQNVIQHTFA